MKKDKRLALALVAVIGVSLCACKSEGSSDTSKKETSSEESTVSSTSETSEVTETSSIEISEDTQTETTEQSESEETSVEETTTEQTETTEAETTQTEPSLPDFTLPEDFEYNNSLSYLNMKKETNERVFGAISPLSDLSNPKVMYVSENSEQFIIKVNGFDALKEKVNTVFSEIVQKYDDEYDASYAKLQKALEQKDEIENAFFDYDAEVTRADNAICSFYTLERGNSTSSYKYNSYNFLSSTGEEILFDDVITDRDKFCDILEPVITNYYNDQATVDQALASARKGSIPFNLCYDGIYVHVGGRSYKISAIENEQLFNMKYFGHTPENYLIEANRSNEIYWDITGNQTTDLITCHADYDDEDLRQLTISVNSVDSVFTVDDLGVLPWYAYPKTMYLMKTDFGFGICIEISGEETYCEVLTFAINGDYTISYLDSESGILEGQPYNPESFIIWDYTNIAGAGYSRGEYSLVGTEGCLKNVDSYFSKTGNLVVAKKDITGKPDSENDQETDSVIISKNSIVDIYGYNTEEHILYARILGENEGEYIQVRIPYEKVEYQVLIEGEDPKDLFYGLYYGG